MQCLALDRVAVALRNNGGNPVGRKADFAMHPGDHGKKPTERHTKVNAQYHVFENAIASLPEFVWHS